MSVFGDYAMDFLNIQAINQAAKPDMLETPDLVKYSFTSFVRTHWPSGVEEAGISIELQVGAINLTAAILVVFPVNLKQMRVILAIIWRGEETTDIMLIVSPHRLLNAVALITLFDVRKDHPLSWSSSSPSSKKNHQNCDPHHHPLTN